MRTASELIRRVALLAAFLVPSIASGGTITYYHNDLAGSPVAASNSSGQVIWQEKYRPYGERIVNAPASADNEVWFTSRRQDADTGLVYMGARFYDPVVGRFMSKDPSGYDERNVHSLNRYAYANNNPYLFVDRNGAWPTRWKTVHQDAINRVLSNVPAADRAILAERQLRMDDNQGNAVQYQHALRIPGQTPQDAWRQANDYVRLQLEIARTLETNGEHADAMYFLGNAIHTMQDATSPSHAGYQEYDNDGPMSKKAEHVKREFFDPPAGGPLDIATQRAWDLFKSNAPIPNVVLDPP